MDTILRQEDRDEVRMLTVCAWCCPGEMILDIYPQLRTPYNAGAVIISHGICAVHKQEMLQALHSGSLVNLPNR